MCGYKDTELREQFRREARERIAKKKAEEGICLTYSDLDSLSKADRIKLAKHVCDKEFR